jgi:ubiquinone/menaquinone biosynthesis C-methylase UbiE
MPVSQFGEPRGLRGWLAAHLVARLTGDANRWMVDCLQVGPHDRVLDVGCGPGLAVAAAAALVSKGPVVGVDASPTMVRLARRRNRTAVRQGRVEIRQADAARLPYPDGHFTRAGSLNSLQFWPSPDDGLRELYRVLEPGGRITVVLMDRSDDPPGPSAPAWFEDTADRLRVAGFTGVDVVSQTFGGVVHRALLGARSVGSGPGKESGAPLDPTADGVRKGAGP